MISWSSRSGEACQPGRATARVSHRRRARWPVVVEPVENSRTSARCDDCRHQVSLGSCVCEQGGKCVIYCIKKNDNCLNYRPWTTWLYCTYDINLSVSFFLQLTESKLLYHMSVLFKAAKHTQSDWAACLFRHLREFQRTYAVPLSEAHYICVFRCSYRDTRNDTVLCHHRRRHGMWISELALSEYLIWIFQRIGAFAHQTTSIKAGMGGGYILKGIADSDRLPSCPRNWRMERLSIRIG